MGAPVPYGGARGWLVVVYNGMLLSNAGTVVIAPGGCLIISVLLLGCASPSRMGAGAAVVGLAQAVPGPAREGGAG